MKSYVRMPDISTNIGLKTKNYYKLVLSFTIKGCFKYVHKSICMEKESSNFSYGLKKNTL